MGLYLSVMGYFEPDVANKREAHLKVLGYERGIFQQWQEWGIGARKTAKVMLSKRNTKLEVWEIGADKTAEEMLSKRIGKLEVMARGKLVKTIYADEFMKLITID